MKVCKILIVGLCVLFLFRGTSFLFDQKEDTLSGISAQADSITQNTNMEKASEASSSSEQHANPSRNIKTVYDFGAVGDGVMDDTEAIQNAVNAAESVYFPRGSYVISRPIIITNKLNWSLYAYDATFVYTGTEYAFRILNAENCNIQIGQIDTLEGGGIEFYSDSDQSWNQYVSLTFNCIECATNCISVQVKNDGWCSENRVFGGRFKAGKNGVFVKHNGTNFTNGWKFYNCGIEGVDNGFMFDAGKGQINDMVIMNSRYEESYRTILKTKGKVFNCMWMGSSIVRPEEINCSAETTQFEVLAPITDTGNRGCIINGHLMVEDITYKVVN